ncbi:TrbC/VirB2 family protein [Hydrogenophaga sp. RWCD_12]|uniref:TrbC/VirB2 family protein n=1 Tax=Hydrogenophaga sp. RWCD_12 TaxID=3391190 RepID=UPI0039846B4A
MVLRDSFRISERSAALLVTVLVLGFLVFASPDVFAGEDTFKDACTKVSGFFKNFEAILKAASISIVTIAVVFAGYQIAFAHKRLTDVAPLLIGGLLIGGASALASWFMSGWTTGEDDCGTDHSKTSSIKYVPTPMDTLRV